MKRIGTAAIGTWEFIAGDDWLTAGGVVCALALTAVIDAGSAWLVMPVAVAILLALSIWREVRKARDG